MSGFDYTHVSDERPRTNVLEYGIKHGRSAVVEEIFKEGADPDKILPNGQTPLAHLYQVSDGLDQTKIIRIRAAIEANKLARVYSDVTFSYSINDAEIPPRATTVAELFDQNSVWKQSEVAKMLRSGEFVKRVTWLHLGLTCVCYYATFQCIQQDTDRHFRAN
jgi:hypothetical protein